MEYGFTENEISKNAFGGTELSKRLISNYIDKDLLKHFQIISSRPRELNNELIKVMYFHDLPEDPESVKFKEASYRELFHGFVFVSDWQYQRYQLLTNLPYDTKSIVIENPIEPFPQSYLDKSKEKIHFVYTSTPQRGLEILVPVFDALSKKYGDKIHLDVFSSFKIYGWDNADEKYEKLYNEIKNHPNMTYHGFVEHNKLKSHLKQSHIFAYPSIWYETSCRALIEAMSAGLVCVHPNLAALPETSGHLTLMYNGDLSNVSVHANTLYNYLDYAYNLVINNNEKDMINLTKGYADIRYNINRISSNWNTYLESLLSKYPTIESRKTAERFIFNV